MNKKKCKFVPRPTSIFLQYSGFLILLASTIPVFYIFSGIVRIIGILFIILIAIADLTWGLLSITIGNNRPISMDSEGITKKQKKEIKQYRWEEATSVKIKRIMPAKSDYGYLYVLIYIRYVNGDLLCFQINDSVIKNIKAFCKDQSFLSLLSEALKEKGLDIDL